MSDQTPNQDKKLSEIGHLFLSSIRSKASNGSPPPRRTPPGQRRDVEIDLTPEEFAQVFGQDDAADQQQQVESGRGVPEVTAVIASHLNGKQLDRVREYARHLTANGSRIGLIEIDASEFRLSRFDTTRDDARRDGAADPAPSENFDARLMTESLDEVSADVDRWLLLLPTPRVPEARAVLREARRWVLLCTCDHDGVVACYRTLKGLADLWQQGAPKPRLSLALLDAVDDDHAQRIAAKLAGVCAQFLNWPLEAEAPVHPVLDAAEHLVLCCRPLHDKTQIAAGSQWQIVTEFLARAKANPVALSPRAFHASRETEEETAMDQQQQQKKWAERLTQCDAASSRRVIAELVVPTPAPASDSEPTLRIQPAPVTPAMAAPAPQSGDSDVIDLAEDASETSILSAVLHSRAKELVECPIAPPMCPTARLAVARDHRIVLVAVARQGLAELHNIGQAFRWLTENRSLIGMALPQLSIDTSQPPQLSLLIDQADSSASTLRPILQSGQVTVQTYRTLRWSGKRGLLLEAA